MCRSAASRYGPGVTTTDQRAAEEAEVARWALRRRLGEELLGLASFVAYAALLFTRDEELRGLAVAFPFLAVAIRVAKWRWEDRAARTARARVAYALWHHRLVGWARTTEVSVTAQQRVDRAWWNRLGMAVVVAVLTAVVVLAAHREPTDRVFLGYGLLAGTVFLGLLVKTERELRDARRWLADPPG